jgi:hypothetical protein
VIHTAEAQDVDKNEYRYISGKYKVDGDWLTSLPKTREWFNKRLSRNNILSTVDTLVF